MKTALIISLFAIFLPTTTAPSGAILQGDGQNRGKLASAAALAKSKGETSARISAPGGILWAGDRSIDNVLAHFSVVIARPVDSFTSPRGPDDIVTWFRFQIVEKLWDQGRKAPHRFKPPSPMSMRLVDSEFLVPITGGTTVFEGIEITQNFAFPAFQVGETYLLVARIDDQQVALLNYGPHLVMTIDDMGRFSPILSRDHPARKSFFERVGKSRSAAKRNLAAMKKQ